MSRDFHLLIDAAVSAEVLRDNFVNAQGFTSDSDGWLVGAKFNAVVTPSTKRDAYLAEPGIANPTLTVTLMPNTNAQSTVTATRAILSCAARLLQSFTGDAALTAQDSSTCVLRINGVVHVDRNQVPEEWLGANDVAPSPLVVGIPAIAELGNQ